MGKWVLYIQPNYAHPKPTKTRPFDTPNIEPRIIIIHILLDPFIF